MRRDAFIKELEYLLQDIPDEDKADAIAYYQDYLEEAGPENEEKVIQDFGSPERIAAIIRADICGSLKDGGEFTEKGYEDERFREPNFQLVKSQEAPKEAERGQEQEKHTESSPGTGTDGRSMEGESKAKSSYGTGNPGGNSQTGGNAKSSYGSGVHMEKPRERQEKGRWEWWQIVGMIILGCCILPVVIPLLFGLGGGAIGLAVGLGGLLVAVIVTVSLGLAAVTLVFLLGGILLIIVSFGQMSISMVQGVLCLGTGVGIFGIGLLCLALCGLYYGIFLPWLVKGIINLLSRLVHRKEVAV